ncbi:hypothetical protein AWC05_28055 [Mycobacterium florentinum]|uniref:Twin-arginine translocation pathway signal n=1 Tax=Mycobacterium florentinum TaxID=292462 RepID=A0A1X1U410_MYCFL|nr:hypothetical protein [Mycobacterium florentinum]MCV7411256.1 hypothetical protein [Mycobacterium florentinum]ORV51408.1 hypothetical protein AWC05_28055 [Mycobacterium florentinum]BBX80608.1 hypothetical protein MFLOJ_43950 [Mycobacterium florentinum]
MTGERGSSLDSTETASDSTEIPPAEGSANLRRPAAIRRWARRCAAKWGSIVGTTLVVATVGVAAGVYFVLYRPGQRVDDATAHRVVQSASEGAVAVLTYSYDHLDRDFAAAKSHLTGEFLAYYSKFTDDIVGPTAKEGHLTTSAKVIRAAVSDLHPDSAVVLAFVDQTTASMQKKDPSKMQSAVLITLTKVNDSWLIAKFEPVA